MSSAAAKVEILGAGPSSRSNAAGGTKMNVQMKGLLKGLRYISKIFDGKEEQEMQIGFPTDVKHVAHIGWDGPSVNSPSWMNEFPAATHTAPMASDGSESSNNSNKWASSDGGDRGSREKPRRRSGGEYAEGSPGRDARSNSGSQRHSRRHQSDVSTDATNFDPSDGGSRRGRRQNKSAGSGEGASELPTIPKQRQRRVKGSSGGSGGSTRSKARPRAPANEPTIAEPATEQEGEDEGRS